MIQSNNQKFKSPKAAYMGYLFQTFLKRPFGYIISILYIVYLLVILVIVPAALHFEPLFIWNVGGFNMPMFNLFFIAASSASIAVAVFRTGRDDGSDLNISAKPLTKNSTVFLKTTVYLLIMLIICVITTALVAIIKPIFGTYDEKTNLTGITDIKYRGLLLSILIGNIINMMFFGGISVFISMIGGQVITIIGTVAVVFVMCIMNFVYPVTVESSISVLSNKYDAEMLGYSCNTLHQYENPNDNQGVFNFAAIQCTTDQEGTEEYHYDTKKYWDLAERESGRAATNYIDFGKQLSSLYSSFGLDQSKLKEASKLVIGTNSNYTYNIDENTHVGQSDNIDQGNYPVAYYTMRKHLGQTYPRLILIGGNMTLSSSNWYLYTTLFGIDFEALNYISTQDNEMMVTEELWQQYGLPYKKMKDLNQSTMTAEQIVEADQLYENASSSFDPLTQRFSTFAYQYIKQNSTQFDFSDDQKTYDSISKIHLRWAIDAQQDQINEIQTRYTSVHFPFSTKEFNTWYENYAAPGKEYQVKQIFNTDIFNEGIALNDDVDPKAFSRLTTAKMDYAETYANLYKYTVHNFYNLTSLIIIWAAVSCGFFTASVIVYKKTDFK